MVKTVNLQINKKNFVPGFGMRFFRLLSEKWNVPTINGVLARLSVLESITDDVTFDQIEVICDLISASVKANPENKVEITEDEIADMFLSDVSTITKIVEQVIKGFMESIPKPKTVGKQQAAKKD